MINDGLHSTLDRDNITGKHEQSHQHDSTHNESTEETTETRLAKLGNERPEALQSLWQEILFIYSIIMSQFLAEYFVSGFALIIPTLIKELRIPQASDVWPASAFSLAIASTLLIFGCLGDMWYGYPVYLAALCWLLI